MPDPTQVNPDSSSRVESIIDDVIRRRVNGERLGDAQVISGHPELMPDLADWLAKLRLLGRAKQRANDAVRIDAGFEDSFAPRLLVHGFEIQREINRGGQAIVYLARQTDSDELVAIKTLLDGTLADDNARARFEREARILAALDHRGIVKVTQSGITSDGVHFLVMPFIDGESFDSQFTRTQMDRQADRLRLFIAILRAIGAAHRRGIVHRDIKPSNIRIDRDGRPHVLDFGLAQRVPTTQFAEFTQSITAPGQFVGSFPWASPEQAGSGDDITPRSDVYSLGVPLFQLITGGRFPYQVTGPLREVLNNIVKTKPLMPSQMRLATDPRLDAILSKSLAKDPAARYADANELANDLQRLIDGRDIAAMRPIARRRRRFAIIALIFITLLTASAIRWERSARMRAQPMVNGRPRVDLIENCTFVWIPPGEVMMGSPAREVGRLPDEEQHKAVIARGFYMLMTEVPQYVYHEVMGNNPSRFPGYLNPVEQVSWHDAQEFCRRLSKTTGRTVRLPTEAEWEYGCRAGSTTAWSFGDDRALAPRYANFYDQSSPETRPGRDSMNDGSAYTTQASRFLANSFGLVDMHGNVWEWCQDDYVSYSGGQPTTRARRTRRVSRGGSWYDSIYSLRSAHRNPLDPSFKNDNLGFRVVMEE
ncbi:MAG: SUMF1/EgtB/PvdO family nonheme iron enzyme [Anaerolineae bacterium]|nr:SUMF1/EgtB/PvdO family nonheme iron enzyme [Phycisphaerae bacterium]